MSWSDREIEQKSLAEIVRQKICILLDKLGFYGGTNLYRRVLGEVERVLIEEALIRSKGSKVEAAKILGIHRNTLRARIRILNIRFLKEK
jgi:two-component system nitrogen regulation response regulator GlnG